MASMRAGNRSLLTCRHRRRQATRARVSHLSSSARRCHSFGRLPLTSLRIYTVSCLVIYRLLLLPLFIYLLVRENRARRSRFYFASLSSFLRRFAWAKHDAPIFSSVLLQRHCIIPFAFTYSPVSHLSTPVRASLSPILFVWSLCLLLILFLALLPLVRWFASWTTNPSYPPRVHVLPVNTYRCHSDTYIKASCNAR